MISWSKEGDGPLGSNPRNVLNVVCIEADINIKERTVMDARLCGGSTMINRIRLLGSRLGQCNTRVADCSYCSPPNGLRVYLYHVNSSKPRSCCFLTCGFMVHMFQAKSMDVGIEAIFWWIQSERLFVVSGSFGFWIQIISPSCLSFAVFLVPSERSWISWFALPT